LNGSLSSTVTLRLARYFASTLHGCLAPVVRSSVITTAGPSVLSGTAAGASVEGPMASVSARFSGAGAAGGAEDNGAGCAFSEVLVSAVCGVEVAIGAASDGPETCAVVLGDGAACAVAGGCNVAISTGMDDGAP
jgi:hypothetical protein